MRLSIKTYSFQLIILISALFLFQACGEDRSPTRVTFDPPPPYDLSEADTTIITDEGLEVHIIEEGYSPFQVTGRDQISAYYTGRTIENGEIGRVFDSTYKNETTSPGILRNLTDSPISGSQGRSVSPLIEGFRLGIVGITEDKTVIPAMREGEKRVVIIPPSLGYGEAREGTNGYNLRNDTLRFDIELEAIF